ncbi:TIR domain-containing protein [Bradyrhizobium sp. Arg816]|uniref:TIR domain-containing protein n=1 Tax=Bradyrhizobium sp. Arg816 TaxID=2998491 RepID=UPI00249DBBD5|nr:TIR domain-containing protein [Bradyrhizobium sp. Arg816]MDI3566609.1 TIR domain-containing protein [Bradyrhizobium sp. Arg816]
MKFIIEHDHARNFHQLSAHRYHGIRGRHLYADLRQSFGDGSVFMDSRGGSIPWGADWDRALKDALEVCEVLVVLIGPQWITCERSPGVRRLDAPDDWVRNEIATVLRRSRRLVLPVLLRRETPPQDRASKRRRVLRSLQHKCIALEGELNLS